MKDIDTIKEYIYNLEPGEAFMLSDIKSDIEYNSLKKSITRLEDSGEIRRILRGVYDRPAYSNLLKENVSPNPESVARAIARNFNWTIAPTGDTAMNILGISTQVPANWQFVSSGPYRNYEYDKVRIEFIHRANKEIEGMSYISALIIQGVKAIGKENMSGELINSIKNKLKNEDTQIILTETSKTTLWVYEIIKRICKGEE